MLLLKLMKSITGMTVMPMIIHADTDKARTACSWHGSHQGTSDDDSDVDDDDDGDGDGDGDGDHDDPPP